MSAHGNSVFSAAVLQKRVTAGMLRISPVTKIARKPQSNVMTMHHASTVLAECTAKQEQVVCLPLSDETACKEVFSRLLLS